MEYHVQRFYVYLFLVSGFLSNSGEHIFGGIAVVLAMHSGKGPKTVRGGKSQ